MARPSSVPSAASPTVGEPTLDTRRAPASFRLTDGRGAVAAEGQGTAVIDDDRVSVGSVTVSFLDADTLETGDYRIAIGCWPGGVLELSQLGRRFDSFTAELRRTRSQARVAGLLAHGVSMPEVFPGITLGRDPQPVECQVYDAHVTIVPAERDPWQIPLGALTAVERDEEPPSVTLATADGLTVIGHLARRRDEFSREVERRRQAQARQLHALTGRAVFADGIGVERRNLPDWNQLLARWTVPERAECVAALLQAARAGEPRFGFAQLLDPDGGAQERLPDLPDHWATFLLVPAGPLTALEILAGPSAATYLFEAPIDAVNRDLQLLHFRRAALALSDADAELTPTNPYRLALRRLEPLKRLRAAKRARLVHGAGWSAALAGALGLTAASPSASLLSTPPSGPG